MTLYMSCCGREEVVAHVRVVAVTCTVQLFPDACTPHRAPSLRSQACRICRCSLSIDLDVRRESLLTVMGPLQQSHVECSKQGLTLPGNNPVRSFFWRFSCAVRARAWMGDRSLSERSMIPITCLKMTRISEEHFSRHDTADSAGCSSSGATCKAREECQT